MAKKFTHLAAVQFDAERRKTVWFGHADQHAVHLRRAELKLQFQVLVDVEVAL